VSGDERIEAAAIAAGIAALDPTDPATEAAVRGEMRGLRRQDRIWAFTWMTALVVVVPFTIIALWNDMPTSGVKTVLVIAGAIVLVYNLASMLALIRDYERDHDFIYRRDVAHLREQRAAREAARGQR
jgi:hypothetical protein